jgi:hypothetical protein
VRRLFGSIFVLDVEIHFNDGQRFAPIGFRHRSPPHLNPSPCIARWLASDSTSAAFASQETHANLPADLR